MKKRGTNRKIKRILASLLTLAMMLPCAGDILPGGIITGFTAADTPSAAPAGAEAAEQEDEWTVLFYLCGSDLESRYGYATENLKEIAEVYYPENTHSVMMETYGAVPDEDRKRQPGKVNILIETGGSREWHAGSLGMDIDPSALQRWSYNTYPHIGKGEGDPVDSFELMETLPLQSMADPETLSDFIRWGVRTRPAKKYALVLWDHGDGARSGLFIDELFKQDIMYLYELRQALRDGGAYIETVIIDACLMANIETAWNIREYAHWMVASEETVPGKGTAVAEWLRQLFIYPEGSGEWLGRCVCDTTCIKYTNEEEEQFRDMLTWSVTDLTKAKALADNMENYFRIMDEALREYPPAATTYIRYLFLSAEYGENQQHMRDIGSLFYQEEMGISMPLSVRNEAIRALSEAVVYCVRGPGRSEARGLTFCYPMDFSDDELEIYSRNYPMPFYLAYIDSISDWTAPDWVYEFTERLTDIDDNSWMQIWIQKKLDIDGMPGITVLEDITNLDKICYSLYRVDPETGATIRLGRTDCIGRIRTSENASDRIWRAADPMHWPSVDGVLLCMDLVQVRNEHKLYNVPVSMDYKTSILRLGRHVNYAENEKEKINEYEVYGLWEGYEENSALMSRSVRPLSALLGREYRMLYPVDGTENGSGVRYESSRVPLKIYKALNVQEIPLPVGTYYLEYEIDDRFMRRTVLDRIEIQWDGENMTIPENSNWEDGAWINVSEMRRGK